VGSVTAFAHKYRFDLFFRTELNVISLQIAYSFLILIAVGVGITLLFAGASDSLLATISESLRIPIPPATQNAILEQFAYIRSHSLLIIASVIIPITVAFGYLIAHLTLGPTRNALSSQKQFIGNVAHELRTPLAIIKTNTEVALLDNEIPTSLSSTLRSNIEELDRVSDIINNLLSLNTLNRPERISMGNVDIGAVTDAVVSKLSSLIERRRLTLTQERGEFRVVWGNPAALEQILMNILKNAIGYTPAGGQIFLTIKPDYRSHVEVVVRDTGVGIARKDLDRIFEPFFRADRSRVREHGGSGLGLAIVSELVKLHRGRITIKSAPKEGTTVNINLPAGKITEDLKEKKSGDVVAMDFSQNK